MSDRDLAEFLVGARLSFSVQMPVNSFATQADLLNVDTPAWMTRAWTLTLLGYRYSQGPVAFPASPGGSFTQNTDNATSGAGSLAVQLTWGVDGSMESALADYPTHGACMQIMGGNIRVGIVVNGFSTGLTPPLVGGFLAPVARSSLGAIVNPTYSENPFAILATLILRRPIPRRAVAYRIYQQDAIATVDIFVVQEDQAGNIVEQDAEGFFGLIQPSDSYVPVNNRAQYLRITNTNAVTTRTVGIVWLLDLG